MAQEDKPGLALRASVRQFRQAFGPAPFGLVMISLEAGGPSAYLAVNDAFCQLTGYLPGELSGDFLSDVHPDDQPELDGMLQEVISGATDQIRADARLVRKDGSIVPVRLTGSAIQPATGERYLASFIDDATAAEQDRAEIRRLEHELQQSHRLESLGQLVGGITHDFNNLLAVIGNYASLVHDQVSAAEATDSATRWEPVRRDVEQIETAADRATRLIKHLQTFARRQEARPVLLDLGRLVSDVTRLMGEVLGEQVSLVTRLGTELWPVRADPGQLEQAIINIAVNARDAMPGGGQVTIDIANFDTATGRTVTSGTAAGGIVTGGIVAGGIVTGGIVAGGTAADGTAAGGIVAGGTVNVVPDQPEAGLADLLPGRYVLLRISDTGTGMDTVTAGRAFEPFFTTKSGDQAAGLGLSAVRRLIVLSGGKAWLRSQPGTGTTVTMVLPAAAGSSAELTGSGSARPATGNGQAGTVLVVDDEAAIRDVAHRILTQAGYGAVTAAGPPEALVVLANLDAPIDLILTDVVMPGMTAAAFTARARLIRPGIRVLFMSGYEQPGPIPDGWPGPGAQVLDKPFSRATLLAMVSQLLTAQPAARS